jgi:transposase
MLRQMERSVIQHLAKRGRSQRQIAEELGHSRNTVARALRDPVDQAPAPRQRSSRVDPYRPQIEGWLKGGWTIVRMLEEVRADPANPYTGGRSVFSEAVRRIRLVQRQAAADVPVRFEGLPGEYLQVDWGEIRNFPFSEQAPATRYFLACRLKFSRWAWVRWTADMRQETLFRGLVDGFVALGFVPWDLVFDNMKTVTSGRDAAGQPIWTPALLQLAAEFDFHPEACAPAAGNQKGAVESLVKWVKGNFLLGRGFRDDADLEGQSVGWAEQANRRPSSATGVPPLERLPEERAKGGALPPTAADYGFLLPSRANRESMVAALGNRYSVPVAHAGAPILVRVHRARLTFWRDTTCLATHERAPDGAGRYLRLPEHFAALFAAKPRARVMLYRQALLDLGEPAAAYVAELSHRRRDRLAAEVLALHRLFTEHGPAAFAQAIARLLAAQLFGHEYVSALLSPAPAAEAPTPAPPSLVLDGVPPQAEIDPRLGAYEAFVLGARPPSTSGGPPAARSIPALREVPA